MADNSWRTRPPRELPMGARGARSVGTPLPSDHPDAIACEYARAKERFRNSSEGVRQNAEALEWEYRRATGGRYGRE